MSEALVFHAPDYDAENSALAASLPLPQLLALLNNFRDAAVSEPLPVPERPAPVETPAFRHRLSPPAVVALNRLNYRAKVRAYFDALNPENLLNLASSPVPQPREPGEYTPPKPKRDPKDVAKAKRLAKEVAHVHALEEALVTAKARLETLK